MRPARTLAPRPAGEEIGIEFERPRDGNRPGPERAILIGFPAAKDREDTLEELALLADTAGAVVVGRVLQRRSAVHPGTFLSRGKLEEAGKEVEEKSAGLVVSDEDLSPAQVRNLEEALKARVIDRSELILDIFSQRARTREAKAQVELAQLRYLLPRLTGMWGHLSRTGGGIGTRGPGETQLEVDRRRVRQKISVLEKRLQGVEVEREVQAKQRQDLFRIALVGYTNAGKSTLFNQLTHASVLAEDKLFATLDTTTRRLWLPGGVPVLISDTVGLIRKLPHHLIASFHATLREVESADLLVHVVDAGHPARREQISAVEGVLDQLLSGQVPRLLVLNKADTILDEGGQWEVQLAHPEGLLMSALRPEDFEKLRSRLVSATRELRVLARIECPASRRDELSGLLRRGERKAEGHLDGRVWGEWWLDRRDLGKLRRAGFHVEVRPEESSG